MHEADVTAAHCAVCTPESWFMGPETAAHALPPSAIGIASINVSSAQPAEGQHGSSSPQDSGHSTASGQQWPAKDTGPITGADRPALKPTNTPVSNGREAPDVDCCTPRSELSFGHWKDKQLSESPQGGNATAFAEPLQHSTASRPSADSANRRGSLPNAAEGTADVNTAADRSQLQPSPGAGDDGGAVAQAAGAVQPDPAAPQPAADAKPVKRHSREDHLS